MSSDQRSNIGWWPAESRPSSPQTGEMTMSTKLTTAFVAAVIAMTSPALPAGNGNRDNEHSYKSAQYCMPPPDEFPATTSIYCRA
jgi:hypothetical protein